MRAMLSRSSGLLLICAIFMVHSSLGAQSGCALCINGICYNPPPVPMMEVVPPPVAPPIETFRNLNAFLLSLSLERQVVTSPGGDYPAVPVWKAWTCPNSVPILLYGSIALPPVLPPYSLPGVPTSAGTSGAPAPLPAGGTWNPGPHAFWCYSNALSPYGPCTVPGLGGWPAPPSIPSTPAPGASTPVSPAQSPPIGPPPTPWPPVPFGPDAEGMRRIVLLSGCYSPIDPIPAIIPAGTLVVIWAAYPDGSVKITHACLSNGDGTVNSKNGLTPHTPALTWEQLANGYGTNGPWATPGAKVYVALYRKNC